MLAGRCILPEKFQPRAPSDKSFSLGSSTMPAAGPDFASETAWFVGHAKARVPNGGGEVHKVGSKVGYRESDLYFRIQVLSVESFFTSQIRDLLVPIELLGGRVLA